MTQQSSRTSIRQWGTLQHNSIDLPSTMDGVPAIAAAGVTDFRAHLPIPSDTTAAHDYLAEAVTAFRPAAGC